MMADYQLFDPLSEDEYERLKEDIQKHGVKVAVEYDENDNILDGHHRVQICEELGITDWPRVKRFGMSERQKYEYALALNIARRHMTGDQIKRAQQKLEEICPGMSDRYYANQLGTSEHTIANNRSEFATAQDSQLQKTMGIDGKNRPSSDEQAEQQRQDIRNMIVDNPDMNNHQIAQATGASDHTVERQREFVNNPPEPEPEYPDYPDIAEDVVETEERYEYSIELGEIERNLHNSIVTLDTALEYITSSNNQMAGSEEFCRVIADQLDDCEAIINKYRRILRENAE